MDEFIRRIGKCRPEAGAIAAGLPEYKELKVKILLYRVCQGSIVTVEAKGLPKEQPFAAVHIHNGVSCEGNADDYFAEAGAHLNFGMKEHPYHTGDLPPLLNNSGFAWGAFFTDRFSPIQVIDCPFVVHLHSDDFHTQPSGGAGIKIACGIIRRL